MSMPYVTNLMIYQSPHLINGIPIKLYYFFYAKENHISSLKFCCPTSSIAKPKIENNCYVRHCVKQKT